MKDKPIEWANTRKRFVAFMDIMGFRDRVYRSPHRSVLKTMLTFQTVVKVIENIAKDSLNPGQAPTAARQALFQKSAVRPVFFSDSLLLVSSDDSEDAASLLLTFVDVVMERAALNSIPIKGAVAHGQQTADFDRSLYFGRPLIDAYELQNELMMYGVVLHHSMEHHLAKHDLISTFEGVHIHKYATPLRAGSTTHYVVDWDATLLEDEQLKAVLAGFYGSVSGSPRRYVDNTADFLHWLAKQKKSA